MLVFLVIVVAAGVVLARSLIRKSSSTAAQTQRSFAKIQPEANLCIPSVPNATPKPAATDKSGIDMDAPPSANATAKAQPSNEAPSKLWGKPLDSLASLDKVAAETDAVFVLVPAEDERNMQPITKQIEAAAKNIQSGGIRISAFTLGKGAPSYAQLAIQFSLPCVLAMVKGGGASGVSGEITETKLVQAFVMASRPRSGCGPGSADCGPSGAGRSDCK